MADSYIHRGLQSTAHVWREVGSCGVVERRLLAPSLVVAWDVGTSKAQIRYACADIGLPVHRSERRRQRPSQHAHGALMMRE